MVVTGRHVRQERRQSKCVYIDLIGKQQMQDDGEEEDSVLLFFLEGEGLCVS